MSHGGKVCKRCRDWKPFAEFHKSRNRDGLANACKKCAYERSQALRKKKQARTSAAHIPETKQCAKCGVEKMSAEFAVYRAANDGLGRYCRECDSAVSRARRYGIPEDRVRVMAGRPRCEICNGEFPSTKHQHFDHRHSDGAVRGVLCSKCNSLVGISGEDGSILLAVARYLARTESTDYRIQPYSVTDLPLGDIDHVGRQPAIPPEKANACPKKHPIR